MWILYEALARERAREVDSRAAVQSRQLARIARARRLQRRAESASRRARALLLSA